MTTNYNPAFVAFFVLLCELSLMNHRVRNYFTASEDPSGTGLIPAYGLPCGSYIKKEKRLLWYLFHEFIHHFRSLILQAVHEEGGDADTDTKPYAP